MHTYLHTRMHTCIHTFIHTYISATALQRESVMGATPAPQLLPLVLYSLSRDPTPLSLRLLARPAQQICDHFLDIFLQCHFGRFWLQLGLNLPPNLGPKSTKNRSKSRPNSNLTCILFSIAFGIDFGRNFHRFSTPKSTKNQSKFNKKSTQHHNNQKTKKFIITRQGR